MTFCVKELQKNVGRGGRWIIITSICPSVCPSVCGFFYPLDTISALVYFLPISPQPLRDVGFAISPPSSSSTLLVLCHTPFALVSGVKEER